jgi:uncharacterized protein YkwD
MLAVAGLPEAKSMKTLRFLRGQLLPLGTIVLALTVALPASASAKSSPRAVTSSGGCAGANSVTQDMPQLMRTILCLHNYERRMHGLRSLRWNHDLSLAAAEHGQDMVRRHYFDHRSPSGTNHMDRLAAIGYGRGTGCWSAGENLLSSQTRLTPRQILTAWMGSQAHRHDILHPPWREFGLGVVMTSPSGQPGGMTIVALFGTRTMPSC